MSGWSLHYSPQMATGTPVAVVLHLIFECNSEVSWLRTIYALYHCVACQQQFLSVLDCRSDIFSLINGDSWQIPPCSVSNQPVVSWTDAHTVVINRNTLTHAPEPVLQVWSAQNLVVQRYLTMLETPYSMAFCSTL